MGTRSANARTAVRTAPWWDSRLLARWIAVNAVGYLVVVAGGVALEVLFSGTARALARGSEVVAVIAVALVGASFHGFIVGRWQWRILRSRMPSLPRTRWVVATFLPALALWLLVWAPQAVDVITAGGNTLRVFRDAFVQALVFGPLIGVCQATALRGHTTRWAWWSVANITTYLFAALTYQVGETLLAAVPSLSRFTAAFPLLAFVLHGVWMLWVSDPRARPRVSAG